MTRPVQQPEEPKGSATQAGQKRRSLSDGPAVRRALAQAESDAKSNAGWKLLEAPQEASHVSEVSGLLKTVDDTQPEPSWKVVAVVDEPMPTNTSDPAPTSAVPVAAAAQQTASQPMPAPSPTRRPTPAQGTVPRTGVPRPTGGARPSGASVPRLDAAARVKSPASTALATAGPALAATQKSAVPPAAAGAVPRPTRRQTPPALPVERSTPIPKPRSMLATQLGVAPPPALLEAQLPAPPPPAAALPPPPPRVQAALAATQIDAAPSTVRVDPALARTAFEGLPSTARIDPALAKTALGAPDTTHPLAAFADTQLAMPRPPEVDALLDALDDDAPTLVQVPEFEVDPAPPTQAAAPLLQAPITTRSPDVASVAFAAEASLVPDVSPPEESRAALSSEVFATTQDTVPPVPMRRFALQLPSPFDRWSRAKLIGVACAAGVAAALPLVTAAAVLSSRTHAHGATAAPQTVAPLSPASPRPKPVPPRALPAPPSAALPAAAAPAAAAPPAAVPAAAAPAAAAPPAAAPPATTPVTPSRRGATPVTAPPLANAAASPIDHGSSADPSAIPWLDRPGTSTPNCDSLASVRPGPKGFLLQQAIKRGQQNLIRGNVEAAHAAFCEAVLLGDPSDAILIGLAQVLLMQSDTSAALKAVDQMLAERPNNRQALDLRGDILIRMGRADEARETWYRAAGASRASASLIENLRRVNRVDAAKALKAGDLARADRLWRRVIALDVRDVASCAELAAVLARNADVTAARRWLAYADTLDPSHPRLTAVKASLDG